MAQSLNQKRRGLVKANVVRQERAALRAGLESGGVDPWALLRGNDHDWEPVVVNIGLEVLLKQIPGVGPVTAEEALLELGLNRRLTLAVMSFQRRAELALLVRQAVLGV